MFSCEYCEIFKNFYFKEHLRTATSETCHIAFSYTEKGGMELLGKWVINKSSNKALHHFPTSSEQQGW